MLKVQRGNCDSVKNSDVVWTALEISLLHSQSVASTHQALKALIEAFDAFTDKKKKTTLRVISKPT